MFRLYYSNYLETQKEILFHLIQQQPLKDPFSKEVILVQSQGMGQWLQLQFAQQQGIAANLEFLMPASFIWRCYSGIDPLVKDNFASVDQFQKELISWRLMRLIPQHLEQIEFAGLRSYLVAEKSEANQIHLLDQEKLFQLANKIADLFVQYLVYRLDWISLWEESEEQQLIQQLHHQLGENKNPIFNQNIENDVRWQAILWRSLVEDIRQQYSYQSGVEQTRVWHRANLQQHYLQQLVDRKNEALIKQSLPQRVFVFGISALPQIFLETLRQLGEYIEVHLFFNSPSPYYWGDIVDPHYLNKLRSSQLNRFRPEQLYRLEQQEYEISTFNEQLQIGHPLLSAWGKLGRDFLYLLAETDVNGIEGYAPPSGDTLLSQLKRQIYNLSATPQEQQLFFSPADKSISFHACHSAMREVEVLHDHLLQLFEQDPTLTPRDIIVMVPDIDCYTPYIQAVFSQYQARLNDKRAIPYVISDRKLTESDLVISAFLQLFSLGESEFNAEEILELLDIEPIRMNFGIDGQDIDRLRNWLDLTGIRFGLDKFETNQPPNYNSWQNGLERMLLGYAMREQQGIWQDTLAFDFSTGLQAKLAGNLYHFISVLKQWRQVLLQPLTALQWQDEIFTMLNQFFVESSKNEALAEVKLFIRENVLAVLQQAEQTNYQQPLSVNVIQQLLANKLNEQVNNHHFLMGKVNFCTLMPMRAIPFKVICLLGMNDGDFPRQVLPNSFDLMQYLPRKGDRSRREDDSYLFLEALLSAQERLYISYIGRSITNNTEKEPAVPVSRLLDYLTDNIQSDQSVRTQLLTIYPMTVFSPNNFIQPHFSYAKEWLLPQQKNQLADFVQPIAEENCSQVEITLDQLIAFVCSPISYFFEQRLGVSFYQREQELAGNEYFHLDTLVNYWLTEELLDNPQQWQYFAENAEHKGMLPRGGFTEVAKQRLYSEIDPLLVAIKPYRSQTISSVDVNLIFDNLDSYVQLSGRLTSLFNHKQVYWRAGKIRERDQLSCWIKYLVYICQNAVTATNIAIPTPLFIGREKDKVVYFEFKAIEPKQAKEQLEIYLHAYLQAQKQLPLIPTYELAHYHKLVEKESSSDYEWSSYLSTQTEDHRSGIYWQRTLQQTQQPDMEYFKQLFTSWFALMLDKKK
ncbi:exodeoxyribonuclease V subunit gamma [Mergibacter septicus]|uniref:exodeoxyribonuclease V subunit gamma n=1 Tax=Mergibacter septicus TaxID=221402 RepID=UPI001179757D|nr:exodeoxyribonuclease V subunit gamma [Mergibacter septicus]AWX14230.1 exodeoxyribonuclease V subunit gamma [Mergibacter septicus]